MGACAHVLTCFVSPEDLLIDPHRSCRVLTNSACDRTSGEFERFRMEISTTGTRSASGKSALSQEGATRRGEKLMAGLPARLGNEKADLPGFLLVENCGGGSR